MSAKVFTIVIIDDDVIIRSALKILIWNIFGNSNIKLKLYSSKDGIEGLGLIEAANPDLIIVDSTLPRYSGLEVIEELSEISQRSQKPVILIHDESLIIEEFTGIHKLISKKDKNFTTDLTDCLADLLKIHSPSKSKKNTNFKAKLIQSTINKVIIYANLGDLLMLKISKLNILLQIPLYIYWGFVQLVLSFYYSFLLVLTPKVFDSNIKQGMEDIQKFRVRTYPSLVATFCLMLFVLVQTAIFTAGGVVLFNTIKIESIFAATNGNYSVNLSDSEYNSELIELVNGSLQLKENIITEEYIEEPTEPDPLSYALETPKVLSRSIKTFSLQKPIVTFNQNISFTELKAIYEISNVNTVKEDSLKESSVVGSNKITYQLSPDNQNWFYYGSELVWEQTQNQSESSNTIQEINKYLPEYQIQVGGNDLYIRAFFISDGSFQIILNSLEVERELSIISTVATPLQEETNSIDLNENIQIASYTLEDLASYPVLENEKTIPSVLLTAPTLFSASTDAGQTVVYGKVLNVEIPNQEISKYFVEAYYTDSNNIQDFAADAVEFIGDTKLSINSRNEIIFTIISSKDRKGYVTARLVYITESGDKSYSILSKPLEN